MPRKPKLPLDPPSTPVVPGTPKDRLKGAGGMTEYGEAAQAAILTQPRNKVKESTLQRWSNTAYILALRAQRAASSYGKKDFNALYRLVLSAGIAYDKAYPTEQVVSNTNLVVQLFGSLGQGVAATILQPSTPRIEQAGTVDAIAQEIPSQPIDNDKDIVA